MKQSTIIRLGGLRAIAVLVMSTTEALAAILLLPAVLPYPSASEHRPDVVIHDEVDIYHEQTLRRGLEEWHYDREVRIVVLSIPETGAGNFDEEIVKHTTDDVQGSSWFQGSDVGNPVDGAVLSVVALEPHWMRCCTAKDSWLSTDRREVIENVTRSHCTQNDWDGKAVAMGQQLTTYIGSGDGSNAMMWVAGAVLALMVGSGWFVFYMQWGITGRRLGRAVHKKMMQVVYDYDLTELKAETLPVQSSQSHDISSDYGRFLAEYDVVGRAWKNFEEPRGAQWFGHGARAQAARLVEGIVSLVELNAAMNADAATRADTIQNPGGTAL